MKQNEHYFIGVDPASQNCYFAVSVKDKNNKYQHFKVQEEVYIYIKQLETYIDYLKESKLKESKLKDIYKEKFKIKEVK